MEALKKKILEEGNSIGSDIVKVDSFLNHQIDTAFMDEIGEEFARRYADAKADKILTVESSGIAIALAAASHMGYIPVLFAKKTVPNTMGGEYYSSKCRSFTKGTVSEIVVAKRFLQPGERILIIDDFLAHGEAGTALTDVVRQAGAKVVGLGAVIEKKYQGGAARLRGAGFRVESLAVIEKIENGVITFEA